MKYFLCLFFLLTLLRVPAVAQTAEEAFGDAQRALAKNDYPAFLTIMNGIIKEKGRHPSLLLHVARAHALTGDSTASLSLLSELAAMRLSYRLDKDTSFSTLAGSAAFRKIAAEMYRNRKPALRSQAGFMIRDPMLIPGGIAWDQGGKKFYAGSLAKRKILSIDLKGNARDFARPEQDGLREVLGMKVETQKRILWVCSADRKTGRSGLFSYDLRTGSLIRKYLLEDTTRKHLLNDLTERHRLRPDRAVSAKYRRQNGHRLEGAGKQPSTFQYSDYGGNCRQILLLHRQQSTPPSAARRHAQ